MVANHHQTIVWENNFDLFQAIHPYSIRVLFSWGDGIGGRAVKFH